jgi:hypothetical protein
MQKQIRDIASQRAEHVWTSGSPLTHTYTTLSCELCDESTQEATCMPVGYSWRSGWVFLCKKCYIKTNYWEDKEEDLEHMYTKYCIKTS